MTCTFTQPETELTAESGIESSSTPKLAAPDRQSLITSSLTSLVDQIIVSSCTFFTMYLVSARCTKAEVGAFALAATIVNFIRTVQERAIAAPYLAFAYTPGFDRKSFRGSSFIHQSIFALIVAVFAMTVFLFAWGMGLTNAILGISASLAITLPLLMTRDQIRAISAANFEFVPQLVLDVTIGVLQFAGLFLLGWLNHFSIAYVYVVLGLACLIPSLTWFWQHRRSIEFDRTQIVSDWRHNWQYSRWLVGARVVGIFGYLLVPWLVAYFLDKSETGAFAVCSSLVGISLMFVTGLNNFFQPRTIRELRRRGVAGLKLSLVESIAIVSGVLVLISIGFAFFGSLLLGWLFGSAYVSYGHIAFLLSLSMLSVSFSIMFGNGLAALGNSRHYFWGEFACCVVSVGSAVVLIPLWGLVGAAQSLIFGGLAASIVTGLTLARALAHYKPSSHSPLLSINECQP